MMLELTLLLLVVLLGYAWVGYPLLLTLMTAAGKARVHEPARGQGANERTVTILFSAHNEESVIRARLENLVTCLESAGRRVSADIQVGVDGSADKTADIARAVATEHRCIHVHEFRVRRGKVAVLKELVRLSERDGASRESREALLVFTDANTRFGADAIGKLLAYFDDPRVGGVSGRLVFLQGPEPAASAGEKAYWLWETELKTKESTLDSCLGANGAIYAIRRDLFWADIPDNTIVEDLVVGMKVREQGFRMLYEPEAVAEEEFPDVSDEWRRRVRIGSGDFQALWLCRRCLLPRYGVFAWTFWSHKVFRWLTPHMLILLVLICPILMATGQAHGLLLGGGSLVLAAALLCGALAGRFVKPGSLWFLRPFRLCHHFVTMQAALFVGFLRFCRGGLPGYWERTPRH